MKLIPTIRTAKPIYPRDRIERAISTAAEGGLARTRNAERTSTPSSELGRTPPANRSPAGTGRSDSSPVTSTTGATTVVFIRGGS